MEDFHYIPGKENPVDRATRADGKIMEIGIGSEWQCPSFLKKEREEWPLSRDFVKNDLPMEEMRRKNLVSFLAVKISLAKSKLWEIVDRICLYSNNLEKVLRILVRVFRGTKIDFSIFNNEKLLDLVKDYQTSKEKVIKETSQVKRSSIKSAQESFSKFSKRNELVEVIENIGASIEQSELDEAEHIVMTYAMERIGRK